MDDEQKALKSVDRARRADALANDELMKEAFASIEGQLIERWKKTPDPLERDALWQAAQINSKIQEHLQNIIRNGKASKRILDDIAGQSGEPRVTNVAI